VVLMMVNFSLAVSDIVSKDVCVFTGSAAAADCHCEAVSQEAN